MLRKWQTVIFVHGCFWHRHFGCKRTTTPDQNRAFWIAKFRQNRQRDRRVENELRRLGWTVIVIWECETKSQEQLQNRLLGILDGTGCKR